ncbi:MAG: trypsin-like peptidase domain-containing protein [Roseburia sp.]|nr:trypsin-like peptidase domain-containing protein [Ruminococcus sp.]MCM1154206.1 trypsin-like peptidase domain-containing protein [Roseburia sp.]MCM1241332.1 trypsin-like peptidase domain-containing protein [Roseburia sp.]
MYGDNYPNEYQSDQMKGKTETEVSTAGGRFSSQNPQDTRANTQSAGTRYGADGNYGYSGAYRNTAQGTSSYAHNSTYGNSAGSYQYSSTYPVQYGQPPKEKKKKENTSYFKKALVCVSLGLFFGICAGLGFYAVAASTGMLAQNAQNTQNTEIVTSQAAVGDVLEEAEELAVETTEQMEETIDKTETVHAVVSDVSEVVTAVMPAVVSINNTYTETMSYFGQAMTSEAVASGSGIIVGKNDTELLIVTNYHVIEDADSLSVQFVEGSEMEASVKGTDAEMDLAVLAVPLENILNSTLDQIAIATLGDSDALKVGEPAIAIGNSLGYGQSVTTGVISALNRDMELSDGSTGTFIQTDAAINPGNSGGALLNMKGEVIGINSNKIGGSVIEGMGYAIPISAASPIIADLMLRETKNKVAEDERGFLGISGISVTSDVSETYGMPAGVYISQVYEGTAAEAAGLQRGDIITSFDGIKVTSMDDLQRLLEYYAKGDTVDITIMTVGNGGYRTKTVSITLGNKAQQ